MLHEEVGLKPLGVGGIMYKSCWCGCSSYFQSWGDLGVLAESYRINFLIDLLGIDSGKSDFSLQVHCCVLWYIYIYIILLCIYTYYIYIYTYYVPFQMFGITCLALICLNSIACQWCWEEFPNVCLSNIRVLDWFECGFVFWFHLRECWMLWIGFLWGSDDLLQSWLWEIFLGSPVLHQPIKMCFLVGPYKSVSHPIECL